MYKITLLSLTLFISGVSYAQEDGSDNNVNQGGHYNISKFKQLKQELATPNTYRTASGAPGHEYYQQKADYKMDIVLDDENQRIYGDG